MQASHSPPLDAPWCFFDLADIALFLGDVPAFESRLDDGINHSSHVWQIETHDESLGLLPASAFPPVVAAREMLADAIRALSLAPP